MGGSKRQRPVRWEQVGARPFEQPSRPVEEQGLVGGPVRLPLGAMRAPDAGPGRALHLRSLSSEPIVGGTGTPSRRELGGRSGRGAFRRGGRSGPSGQGVLPTAEVEPDVELPFASPDDVVSPEDLVEASAHRLPVDPALHSGAGGRGLRPVEVPLQPQESAVSRDAVEAEDACGIHDRSLSADRRRCRGGALRFRRIGSRVDGGGDRSVLVDDRRSRRGGHIPPLG